MAEGYYEASAPWAPPQPRRPFWRRLVSGFLLFTGISSTVLLAYILLTAYGVIPTALQMLQAETLQKTAQQGPQDQQVAQKAPQQPQPPPPTVPADEVLRMLIRSTLIALNQANMTGNYTVFRELGSPSFQLANTAAKLTDIFGQLRQRNLDLSPILLIEPKLIRAPSISEEGMLRISGFFPSQPEQVVFDFLFERVDNRWRLFGISVDTARAPSPQVQPAPQDPSVTAPSPPMPARPSQVAPPPAPPAQTPDPPQTQKSTDPASGPKPDVRDRVDNLVASPKNGAPKKSPPTAGSFNPFSR